MTVVIGTAGHIDHGKTTLLRALTGIDADRLPEERARGMTIDVGYAHLDLPDGSSIDFVDVPGHDRLVGNMLVGAGEIDAALLVVAADDGPRAQTREHLELLDALGIADGIVVVTKADLVGSERAAEVEDALRSLVRSTSLAGAPIVAASGATGEGLDALRTAILALRDRVRARRPAPETGRPRLAVDRVFTVRGRGTVVTGTLRGGAIERGAILRVVPGTRGGAVRVREVQVHGGTVERAAAGRVALNVAPAGESATLERGVVLTTDPAVAASDRILVELRPAPPDRTRVSVHVGTDRVAGVVGRSGRDAIDLGPGLGAAIVRLERPIAVAPGDRFVLRRPSPAATLAGGRVLDPDPARGVARRRTSPSRIVALARAAPGSVAWHEARRELLGVVADAAGRLDLAPDVATTLDERLVAEVEARASVGTAELVRVGERALRRAVGAVDGLERGVADRLDGLVSAGRLARRGSEIRVAGAAADEPSRDLVAAMDRLVDALDAAAPPPLRGAAAGVGCPPDGIRRLERDGRIVRVEDDLAWAASAYEALTARAVALARAAPLTPAAFRDASGTSRKYVMAILEDLDRKAVLRRMPEGHVPGPRAGAAVAPAGAPAAATSAATAAASDADPR
jgi:selenocysteine-specific elongation factor